MKPQPGSTVDTVRDFWQAHINNEYYTDAERASDSYFDEIEQRRYATHYHLPELFASLDGAGRRLLEVGCGIGVETWLETFTRQSAPKFPPGQAAVTGASSPAAREGA